MYIQCDTKKRELLKCVLAAMYSWQHCGTGTLSYRQPRHFSNHGSDLKRQVIMVQFFVNNFFFISSIFVGVFKSSRLLCHPVYIYIRGVTGGTDQTSGGCSLCYTIPI